MPNPAKPEANIIEVHDLRKTFDGVRYVLDGISFSVARGKTLVIMGASGCGKSTLLRHLIRNLEPTSGSVHLFGREVSSLDDKDMDIVRKRFGVSFQFGALYDSMTIMENIALPIREHFPEVPPAVVDVMVRIKLEQVGLNGIGHLGPSEISGGMRKRVALARATALDPEILFYDEPTAGLDPMTASLISQLIFDTAHQQQVSSVVVTHDMKAAFEIADNIVMLHEGKVVAEGTPDEIRSSQDDMVQQFIQGRPHGPIPLRLQGPGILEELLGSSQKGAQNAGRGS